MKRREFLPALGGLLAAGYRAGPFLSEHARARLAPAASANAAPADAALASATLAERARARGLVYGAASTWAYLSKDAPFAARFAAECGMLVPETELEWNRCHPEPDHYDFRWADWLADFATARHLLLRGHALLYDETQPAWVAEGPSESTVADTVRRHIGTVAGRYAGRMHSWDVVNEIIDPNAKRPDGLKPVPLLQCLGPDYIALAFHAAAAADPAALLCWNDNNLEYDVAWQAARRDVVLTLLQHYIGRGAPIQALGIQSHLRFHDTRFDAKAFRDFLAGVAGLGLKIIVSELDVFDADLPDDAVVRDRAVAAAIDEYLPVVLDERAVVGVVTWGLSDRYTWLNTTRPRARGGGARSLPLDAALAPTAAYAAIGRAFDGAPRRT
ncbi:MAG TPA: endo-1,4-beta-xylanase [Gemmatimonadales bacterium]|nr:endo-1,4-beta-xylanase [Gemmatimonadales bacterium]